MRLLLPINPQGGLMPATTDEAENNTESECRPGECARRALNEIDAQMPDWLWND